MNKFVHMALLVSVAVSMTGCTTWAKKLKAYFGGKSEAETKVAKSNTPKFSNTPQNKLEVKRQYGRMTRDRFETESQLQADAGSLWTMEGQGSYLFAQNRARVVGDLLTVKIDGTPKQQLNMKSKVIEQLLAKIDAPRRRPSAEIPAPAADGAAAGAPTPPAEPPPAAPTAAAEKDKSGADKETFNVQAVPTRIVEQLKDGSYRVRGTQSFMIGKREYAVVVQGIVRPEDFDEEGVSAGRLLDPQFDIVSNRRGI